MVWQLLDTGALPGQTNMEIDQEILQAYSYGNAPPTLRFYQWSPPAVSLGYFQKRHSIDADKCRKLGIDIVRRPTGGRAVLHWHDLTYSLIAGIQDGFPGSVMESYRLICQGLLAGFQLLGISAQIGGETVGTSESDVCFMRFAAGDIVYQGRKFLGSAQRRFGTSFLQHGSIVLQSNWNIWSAILTTWTGTEETFSRRMTSIEDILGRRVNPNEVKAALIQGVSEVMQVKFEIHAPSLSLDAKNSGRPAARIFAAAR